MKQAWLKGKSAKWEILRDSIKYLGGLVDKHGVRPHSKSVEAVLTRIAQKNDTKLMSFLGLLPRTHQKVCRPEILNAAIEVK